MMPQGATWALGPAVLAVGLSLFVLAADCTLTTIALGAALLKFPGVLGSCCISVMLMDGPPGVCAGVSRGRGAGTEGGMSHKHKTFD